MSRSAGKYLANAALHSEKVFGHPGSIAEVDELDVQILHVMDKLEDLSLRNIGQLTGANIRTIERRVDGLRERGVVLGFFYDISPSALGVETYRLLLSWAGAGRKSREDLLRFCRDHRLVVFLNEELGRWDYEIGIETSRASEVTVFHEELIDHFGSSISDISVMTEGTTLKWSFYPFAGGGTAKFR